MHLIFILGCHYPLEPPLVSLTAVSNEFPSSSCLRVTKLLLDEIKRYTEFQQPYIFELISFLKNRQEEICVILNGKAPVFYQAWERLLPNNDNDVKEKEEEISNGDHLYISAADKRMSRDTEFVKRFVKIDKLT